MPATKGNSAGENGVVRRAARYSAWGIGIGSFLSILPLLAYMLFGSKPFADLHTSLPKVLAIYVLGGCIAGALVGLVMPMIRSDVIAAVVGSIVGVLFACAIQIMDASGEGWTSASIFAVVVAGVVIGGSLGVFYRRDSEGKRVR